MNLTIKKGILRHVAQNETICLNRLARAVLIIRILNNSSDLFNFTNLKFAKVCPSLI